MSDTPRTEDDEHFIFATIQEAHDAMPEGQLRDKLMRAWVLMMRRPAPVGFIDGDPTDSDLARIAKPRRPLDG